MDTSLPGLLALLEGSQRVSIAQACQAVDSCLEANRSDLCANRLKSGKLDPAGSCQRKLIAFILSITTCISPAFDYVGKLWRYGHLPTKDHASRTLLSQPRMSLCQASCMYLGGPIQISRQRTFTTSHFHAFCRDNLRGFFVQCFPALLKQLFGYDGSSWLTTASKVRTNRACQSL